MARLDDQIAAAQPSPEAADRSRLALAIAAAGAVPYRDVVIPLGDGVPAKLRLLGLDEELAATSALSERLRALRLGVPGGAVAESDWLGKDVIEAERARQYLMIACRDPDDPSKPVGSHAAWSHPSVSSAVLLGLWYEYADHLVTYDPIGGELALADVERIAEAIEKKSLPKLVGIGSSKLARYLLSTVDQQLDSPTPKSSPGSTGTPTP